MNRLWVRLSLAYSAVFIVVVVLPIFLIFLLNTAGIRGGGEAARHIEETHGPLSQRPDRMLQLVFFSGVIGICAGVWVSHSLSAPLTQLAEAAQAIGKRDFERRVKVKGSQEIITLAQTFNQMATDLQEAERLRNHLMADVSHELRTPLTVLEGHLRAALDQVYELTEEEIANLYQQTRHLIRLVNDLRELAQAEAKQLPLMIIPTDVARLSKETVTIFEPLTCDAGITLRYSAPDDLPLIPVDGSRLRQVLHNLLSNALRHTPRGGIILVTLGQVQNRLQIDIKDSGSGIAQEELPHVFDRFYRTDRSRSRETGGTGLGLSIVKAIIEAHGGEVSATSEGMKQGSCFTICLPVA